jgi:hypothetical protein
MRRLNALQRSRGAILRITVVASLALVACNLGDDYYPFPPPSFGGGTSSRPVDAGSRSADSVGTCDKAEEGSMCSVTSGSSITFCEVKKLANRACNAVLRCNGGYEWASEIPEKTDCATKCPEAYVADRADACAFPGAGSLICEYPEGTCGCAPVRPVGDGGDGGDGDASEGSEDAGESDAGTLYEWRCVKPAVGCPRTRPSIGSDCVVPMRCDYGDCLFEDGLKVYCSDGQWAPASSCTR